MSNKAQPEQWCLSTMKGRAFDWKHCSKFPSNRPFLPLHTPTYPHPHIHTSTPPPRLLTGLLLAPPGGSALCICAFLGPQTDKRIQGQGQIELNILWLSNTLSGPGLTQHHCGPVHTLTQQTGKADIATLLAPSGACTHSLTKPLHAIMPGKRG